jgi:hypothetical protein
MRTPERGPEMGPDDVAPADGDAIEKPLEKPLSPAMPVCGCVGVWVCGCVGVWMSVRRRARERAFPSPRTLSP